MVVLFYEGDPQYTPDVFTTLQGMSLEKTAEGVPTTTTRQLSLPALTMGLDYILRGYSPHIPLGISSPTKSYKFTGKERRVSIP